MLSYESPIPISGKAITIDMGNMPDRNQTTTTDAMAGMPSASTNGTISPQDNSAKKPHHIFLVTGPAGAGKSTVGKYVADELGYPFLEGDDFHSKENIKKMSANIPLVDQDRWAWLEALREASIKKIEGGSEGVVLSCSALKRKYRDVIRVANYYDHSRFIHFIFLKADEEVLVKRAGGREGHYMKADMVKSQLRDLELPGAEEKDVVTLDVSKDIAEVQVEALEEAQRIMREHDSRVNGESS